MRSIPTFKFSFSLNTLSPPIPWSKWPQHVERNKNNNNIPICIIYIYKHLHIYTYIIIIIKNNNKIKHDYISTTITVIHTYIHKHSQEEIINNVFLVRKRMRAYCILSHLRYIDRWFITDDTFSYNFLMYACLGLYCFNAFAYCVLFCH